MPITLRLHSDETTGLVATCDVCGKLLRGDNANLMWQPIVHTPPATFDFKLACEGRCTERMGKQLACEHGDAFTQELDTALIYLLNNCFVNIKSATTKARICSQ